MMQLRLQMTRDLDCRQRYGRATWSGAFESPATCNTETSGSTRTTFAMPRRRSGVGSKADLDANWAQQGWMNTSLISGSLSTLERPTSTVSQPRAKPLESERETHAFFGRAGTHEACHRLHR